MRKLIVFGEVFPFNVPMDERIQNIEDRLASLEKKLERLEKVNPGPSPAPSPAMNNNPFNISSRPAGGVSSTAVAQRNSESALKILPLIGVICFVLAGVFMVRLAIDSGWLTPERQWGLLGLLGLVLTACGRWIEKIDKNYRSYLSAAGIIVLYIAAFSASLYFGILPRPISLILGFAVSGLCLALFNYHQSELFPLIASVGTYISPLLLGSRTDLIFDAGFFILWAILFSTIANYLQTRTLSLTAAYLGIGVFTMLHASESNPDSLLMIILILVIQFFSFAGGVYLYSVKNKSALSQQMALAYLPILLFFYGTTYYFLNRLNSDLAPWISLIFAGLVYLLYWRAKKQLNSLNSQTLVHGFLGVVLFHSGYMQILPETAKPWLLPLLLLATFIAEKKQDFPRLSPLLEKVFLAMALFEFFKICSGLVLSNDLSKLVPGVVTFVLGLFYYWNGSQKIKDKSLLFLGLIHSLAILCFYRIAFEYGSLAVSVAWGIYSALILLAGYKKKDASLAKSSLVVLMMATLKALIYDSSQAPSMVRILSLLVTGALLYGAGLIFQNIKKWESK